MRKLNQRKIRWIIREIEKGSKIKEVAEIQGITRFEYGSCTGSI